MARAAFALAALALATCLFPQTALAATEYRSSHIDSDKLLDNMTYLEYTWRTGQVDVADIKVSGGKIVELSGMPASERNGQGGDSRARVAAGGLMRQDSDKYCYIHPSLWANPYTTDMTKVAYPGDKNDAWAFISNGKSANSGAAGASFTATWKKAAILRSTSGESSANRLIDIRMKTTIVNSTHKVGVSQGDKAVVQFTDDFAKGFYSMGPTVWDQEITFLDSQTGEEIKISGRLGVVNNSLDEGEGFTVEGATAGFVSRDAPHLSNRIGTPVAGLPAELQYSAVPGTHLYEIDENGSFGYIGVGYTGNSVLQSHTGRDTDTIQYVDNRFSSEKTWKVGSSKGTSKHSYQWRSGGVSVPMDSTGTVSIRQYSVAYLGWPNAGAEVPAGVPTNLGANTANLANPYLDRTSLVSNTTPNAGTRYSNIDFGALFGLQPPAPTKSVENHDALALGETVTFSIDQEVNTYPENISDPYKSFVFTDELDPALEFASAQAVYVSPETGKEVALPANAGKISTSGNTVTYAFNEAYLTPQDMAANNNPATAMVYRGGIYRLKVTARVVDDAKRTVENKGVVNVNGVEKESAAAPALVGTANLSVAKGVDFEHAVGDEATYTITVENTEGDSVATGVVVTDEDLPAALRVVEGSLQVSGVPERVSVPCVKNGAATSEERANEWTSQLDARGFKVSIPYLPAGTPVTISFKASCDAEANGQELFNTVRATHSNPVKGQEGSYEARDGLWVNSAQLSLLKRADAFEYRVGDVATYTLSLSNTAPGTIARNVTVSDSLDTELMAIDMDSVVVEGLPDTVSYPVDGNGETAREARENAYALEQDSNGFNLVIDYLPYGEVVTVTYQAACVADANGVEAMNSATAACNNPLPDEPGPVTSQDRVWTNDAVFTLDKQASAYEAHVGDVLSYTVRFENIAAATVAKDVVLTDLTLPEGLALVEDSIAVEGVPEQVDYPIDGEGQRAIEERACTYRINQEGNGFTVEVDYLPAGMPVTVTYQAAATDAVNGDEVVNTATLRAENMLEDKVHEAEATTWVNTAVLAVDKQVVEPNVEYRQGDVVTFRVVAANTKPGTVARNVCIEDAFLEEGMQLVRSSVYAFDGQGAELGGIQVSQDLAGSGFTAQTNADLVCPEGAYGIWKRAQRTDGEAINPIRLEQHTSITIEYQAVVTSALISGKQVINRATASADNAEPVSDEEGIPIAPVPAEDPELARLDVRYVDEGGPVLDSYGSDIPVGPYSTEQKDFDGYHFVSMGQDSAPAQGQANAGDEVEVVYVYRKADSPAPQSSPTPKTSTSPQPDIADTPKSSTPSKSSMAKTGDYLKAHPFAVLAAVAAATLTSSYHLGNARKRKLRRRIRS